VGKNLALVVVGVVVSILILNPAFSGIGSKLTTNGSYAADIKIIPPSVALVQLAFSQQPQD
jgi:ascorbate-specific PTS system EIIC-type component UlaA